MASSNALAVRAWSMCRAMVGALDPSSPAPEGSIPSPVRTRRLT